ncbi:hypothetical protein [Deinococcus sp. Marseille-Q6407]|uniref:hypothetical protein n=1 Tax=Deinococcus sp. Marseille-Q6407 TaxID=2969223 RepID=UPI0021C16025|nr:hypothetical protein [Deinococcus sp. Marseille-Q6407]
MEAALFGAGWENGAGATLLLGRLLSLAGLGALALGLPWALLGRRLRATGLQAPVCLWPLLLTLPALLLTLRRSAVPLDLLGGLTPARLLSAPEQMLLVVYLGAAAVLYYRPARAARTWGWAAALCAAPLLLSLHLLWAGDSRLEMGLLPAGLAAALSLFAWTGLLLAQRPAAARRQAPGLNAEAQA